MGERGKDFCLLSERRWRQIPRKYATPFFEIFPTKTITFASKPFFPLVRNP